MELPTHSPSGKLEILVITTLLTLAGSIPAVGSVAAAIPDVPSVSLDLGAPDIENGLFRVEPADGNTLVATVGGRTARRQQEPSSDLYFYFAIDDRFAFAGSRSELVLTVDYLDVGSGWLTLQYDAQAAPYQDGGAILLTGTGAWKSYRFRVEDAYLGNRQNLGADFRIRATRGQIAYLDLVEVSVPLPGALSGPHPADGAANVPIGSLVSWIPEAEAFSQEVYFGTVDPPPFRSAQATTIYDPGPLTPRTTYFWRIDTIGAKGRETGPRWRFTTAPSGARATLVFESASNIRVDGSPGEWDLHSFTSEVTGGRASTGEIAVMGHDGDLVHRAGQWSPGALPTSTADHSTRIYGAHDDQRLYFLVRVEDDDLETAFPRGMNWANDSVEIFIDPGNDGGSERLEASTSDLQLVFDAANQINVYGTTSAYRERVLSGVRSAVSRDAAGFWLEVEIDKGLLEPPLPANGEFGLDFNFRDNDGGNDPRRTTVYSWGDTEKSGIFPSKIPDRWGKARLPPWERPLSSRIGLNVHVPSNAILDDIAENLEIRWIRVDFDWYRIQPGPGVFDWREWDRLVQRANEQGLEVLAVLAYTPAWASSSPENPRISDPPSSVSHWTAFVREAVSRYRGRIRYWQFWNEPNLDLFWTGSIDQYRFGILEPGVQVAKEIDPGSFSLGPGLAHLGNWRTWFRSVMGSRNFIDIINHHSYHSSAREALRQLERNLPFQPSLRRLMQEAGVDDKPFWLTETGSTSETEGKQLGYYQQMIAELEGRDWIDRLFFFHYWDGPGQGNLGFGIVEEDFTPKPAYHFLRSLSEP